MKVEFLLPLCAPALGPQLVAYGARKGIPAGSPASLQADFQAAMAAEDAGNLARAEAILTNLHKKHPGIFEVDESLGLLYAGQEKFSDALPLLSAAAKERPGSDVADANLGAVLSHR